MLSLLQEVLKSKPKALVGSDKTEIAFKQAKQALANTAMLSCPSPGASLMITTDASDTAVRAVLEQLMPSGPQPIEVFSKKVNAAQAKYSMFDREVRTFYL